MLSFYIVCVKWKLTHCNCSKQNTTWNVMFFFSHCHLPLIEVLLRILLDCICEKVWEDFTRLTLKLLGAKRSLLFININSTTQSTSAYGVHIYKTKNITLYMRRVRSLELIIPSWETPKHNKIENQQFNIRLPQVVYVCLNHVLLFFFRRFFVFWHGLSFCFQ